MRKTKVAPCRHWSVDLLSRACNDCHEYFERPVDRQADRDAHNESVLSRMGSRKVNDAPYGDDADI